MAPETRITSVSIEGYRSIRSLVEFEPGSLNLLIGANGAGKSNFLGVFRLLEAMVEERLQLHVGKKGGASTFLFDGPARTQQIQVRVSVSIGEDEYTWLATLIYAAGDRLLVQSERVLQAGPSARKVAFDVAGSALSESRLRDAAARDESLLPLCKLLGTANAYQFHNTSDVSRFKQRWSVADNLELKADGGNLAPFLLSMRERSPGAYGRVVAYCRQVLPFFHDFVLEPEHDTLLLRWKESSSDLLLEASQASDGMLRVFSLLALLAQPADRLPSVIFLDEPELGLHPSAIGLVASLMRSVSHRTQIFAATQSPALLNEFDPSEVTVVERAGRESLFKRLNTDDLAGWLEEYSLADLWWKNVLGGKP